MTDKRITMKKIKSYFPFSPNVASSLLFTLLFAAQFPALAADKLTVRAGQSGYLGELYPSAKSAFLSYHPSWHYSSTSPLQDPNVNYPMLPRNAVYLQFSTLSGGYINSNFPKYEGAPGIRLINENDPNKTIVLLLNGTVSASFYNANYSYVTKRAVIKRSRTISGNLYQTDSLGWKLENNTSTIEKYFIPDSRNRTGNITADISSFSAYASSESGAPTTITKGRYRLSTDEQLRFGRSNLYSIYGWASADTQLLNDNTLSIEALDSCIVKPMTATNIVFNNQLAGYKVNQLLETRPATLSLDCVTTGKLLMVLSANQQLHGQNSTGTTSSTNLAGMALDSLSGNSANSTERPYIVTTKVPPASDICRNGHSDALVYYDRIKLEDITTTNLRQNLYFNLCQNGNVKAGAYRGSIDVSFYLE